jgi:DNA mismatch repair ATPase MutS
LINNILQTSQKVEILNPRKLPAFTKKLPPDNYKIKSWILNLLLQTFKQNELMEPTQFYQNQLDELKAQLKKLQQKKSSFAWLRLGAIMAIIAVFYLLFSFGFIYVAVATIILLIVFVRLIHADLDNQAKIVHTKLLIQINEDELKSLAGNYYDFPDGARHIPKDHPYSNDLDIFGRASLFQYINRTTSEPGSQNLADYLTSPATPDTILARQNAIKELSTKPLWMQNLQASGRKESITFSTKNRLQEWKKEAPVLSNFKPWKWLRYLLPAIILTIVTLYIFDVVGNTVFYSSLLIFAVIAYQLNKVIAPVHEKLSKIASELKILSESVAHIEKETFSSPLLKELQSGFLINNRKASEEIYLIKKILDKLDLRYNLVISFPLNILLLWNLQQVLDLEKWKADHQNNFDSWFETLANFEALSSFATIYFNEPEWIFPTIVPAYFEIKGKEIGHPLIPKLKRVNNYIDIASNAELMLVTGSNMAGKSTYLRSIGINTVLAMAGAPICAKEFIVSHVQIISSMRITDNLEESTSTFYAELKKLKTIIEKVNAGDKVFILLDEILRGTNSLDRHTGSKALIKQLIKKKAAAIIATHDLELANLKDDYPENILNYHFDVQVENEELYFDYLLKPGVCNSLNASILMKKIGIELNN